MQTAEDIVDAFLRAIVRGELEVALEMVSEDVLYDNVPMEPVHGRDGMRRFFASFLPGVRELDWQVHRQVASENVVMNERTDRFRLDGGWFEIDVAGLFVIRDGRVALWRDYFDLRSLERAVADVAPVPSAGEIASDEVPEP